VTNANAYGSLHQRRREELLPAAIGQACAVCGYEMRIGQALHLDHSDPEAKRRGEPGDRIIHAECNQERRGLKGKGPRYRDCLICGTSYHGHYAGQLTCSRACGIEMKRRNSPPRKHEPRPPALLHERQCSECGTAFETYYGQKKTCGPACSEARASRRARQRMRNRTPLPPASAVCVHCGALTWTGKRGRPRKVCERCDGPASAAVRVSGLPIKSGVS